MGVEKGKGGGKERGREGERKGGGGGEGKGRGRGRRGKGRGRGRRGKGRGEGKGRKINGVDAYWKVIPRSTLNRNRRIVVVDETLISVRNFPYKEIYLESRMNLSS